MVWSQLYQDTVHWGFQYTLRRSKFSDSTKGGKFRHHSVTHQLLKTDSTPKKFFIRCRNRKLKPATALFDNNTKLSMTDAFFVKYVNSVTL